MEKEKEKIKQHISAIENNYPPENYTMLREALDYCLKLLKEKGKKEKPWSVINAQPSTIKDNIISNNNFNESNVSVVKITANSELNIIKDNVGG